MGINDIFEPTRADFTPMTDDPLIYAKHIEQSININIRTQSLQQLKSIYLVLCWRNIKYRLLPLQGSLHYTKTQSSWPSIIRSCSASWTKKWT